MSEQHLQLNIFFSFYQGYIDISYRVAEVEKTSSGLTKCTFTLMNK